MMKDDERAEHIKSWIDCDEGRIGLCFPDRKLHSFEDITDQIDRVVKKIQEKIAEKERKEGKKIKWLTDEEKIAAVFQRGYFDVDEDRDVDYEGITKIYGSCIRHYERVGTRVNISDLKSQEQ